MSKKTLLVSLIATAMLVACGGGDKAQQKATQPTAPAEQQATAPSTNNNLPTIKVGTDATYPPFEYRDEKGNIFGIEADLLKAIGKNQGFNVNMEHSIRAKWSETLGNGMYDIWASAFYEGNQYAEHADMTKPFMEAYIVVALCGDAEGNKNITSSNQLHGKKIAVSKYYGQGMIDLATKLTGSPDNVIVTDTFYLSARELYTKRVDGVLGANYVLAYYATETDNQAKTRFVAVEGEAPRKLVFLVKKGNQELLDKLNKGIDQALADGTIKALQDKWLSAWNNFK